MMAHVRLATVSALLAAVWAAPAAFAQPGRALNCADPQFQAEMNMCAEADYETASAEMNAVYDQAIAQYREQDRTYAEADPQYTGAEKLLIESQKSWIASSAAFCSAQSVAFFGGSLRPTVHYSCLARLTRNRTEELQSLLE